MTTTFEEPDAPSTTKAEPISNPIGLALGEWLRELIWTGSATSPRSLQRAVGMSEVGVDCEREIAYKIAGTRRSNINGDPMASIVGTGIHLVLADMFRRMDQGIGRWLIEHPVSYEGIPGSCDAYDTRRKLLLDWKSTSKGKIRRLRTDGPPGRYIVQAQLYAAALKAAGEDPQQAALVYLARDGELADLFVWPIAIDQSVADNAVARIKGIAAKDNLPGNVPPTPSRLCGWCDFYRPGSTDLNLGCPGQS